MMKFNYLAISLLTISFAATAAPLYDPTKSYLGGEQVSFNGDIYQTQWWANPNQSPADITDVPWESPWILLSEGNGEISPDTPPVTAPIGTAPETPPTNEDIPTYSTNQHYQGGDIVQHQGKRYRCIPGVTVPWCSGAAWAYAPGTGTAWTQAWELISHSDVTQPVSPPVAVIPTPQPPIMPPAPAPVQPVIPAPEAPAPVAPGTGYTITRAALMAKEAELTDFPAMTAVKQAIRTRDNDVVEHILPSGQANPDNVKRVEEILSQTDWDYLFPKRDEAYSYRKFLQAIGKFPAICQDYPDGRNADAICRRTLATMFAHFAQETGGHTAHWDVPEWRQALVHVREMGWNETMRDGYNGECNPNVWQGQTWPCGTFANGEFKSYFGRGAKQLSYNYNYGPFSEAMFGTVRTLLDNPELVADTWLNLASAVFFFSYPQPPKPSMLHVIDGTWQPNNRDLANGLTPGFGVTTQIINGGVECGGSVEVAQSRNRISYFNSFANYLDVPIDENEVLGCKGMQQFDADGAGAINIYWEKDWGWSADTPDGSAYACQLVGYQTPYSAFKTGDYEKCVKANFPNVTVVD